MSFKIRKRGSFGKSFRFNLGKKSFGWSTGIKGMRFGFNSKRGTYSHFSIPGTKIRAIHYKRTDSSKQTINSPLNTPDKKSNYGLTVLIIFCVILLLAKQFGLLVITLIFAAVIYRYKSPSQKFKRLLTKANQYFQQGYYQSTLTALEQAQSIKTNDTEFSRLLAITYNNLQRYEEAIAPAELYYQRISSNYEMILLLANCYCRTNRLNEAIKLLQAMPEGVPQRLKAIMLLAACFFEKEQYALALEALKAAPLRKRNLDNELMTIHYMLGLTYEKLGNTKDAFKHFNRVYAKDVSFKDVAEKINI